MYQGAITDIKGIKVGCADNAKAITGCTAVLFEQLTTAGVDVRGGGPGTINTDVLAPTTGGCVADCIMLAGGSAFGLDAVTGAMQWLEERGRGFETGLKRVPMVPGAIIYDLGLGDVNARPDGVMGYTACDNAVDFVKQGSYGGGMGATVGKVLLGKGMEKCGQGTASIHLDNGIIVAALAVVNALGDVYEGEQIIAGVRDEQGNYLDTMRLMIAG
ncbi:MAG: P1 family peptidase, partial [Clostridiales bacterium]